MPVKIKNLWIMRHGLAESDFDTDFNRALSSTGHQQSLDIAQQLKRELIKPEYMLVSPFKRTQQTAELVHQGLGMSAPFETEEMLVHFADHQVLGDYLSCSEHSNLMVVSHMPIVAKLTQYLAPSCAIFGFQTAQVVHLENNGKYFELVKSYLPSSN
ncbi:phosphohistidine phosphatase SixA [Aliikangiella sp. IMCC44653]